MLSFGSLADADGGGLYMVAVAEGDLTDPALRLSGVVASENVAGVCVCVCVCVCVRVCARCVFSYVL